MCSCSCAFIEYIVETIVRNYLVPVVLYTGTANVRLLASCFIVHTCVDTNDSTQQLERAERLGQLNCTGML